MSFHYPHFLWLLLLLSLVLGGYAWSWQRRRRATRQFGSAEAIAVLRYGKPDTWRIARVCLRVLVLALLILTLAGPRFGNRTRLLRKRGIDLVIALDFSKSMLAADVKPNRIARAKAELLRFVRELKGDRVGLVAFAGDTMQFPLTHDDSALTLFLEDLHPLDMPVGGTAIGRALVASKRLLERSARGDAKGAQAVVLLTDGEDHVGDPIAAAQELAQANIPVHVIGIGSRTGEPVPTYSADGTWTGYMRDAQGQVITTSLTAKHESALRRIATLTQGSYTRAKRGQVGTRAIRRAIAAMKQQEQQARRIQIHEDRYALALFPAFLLLLLELLLPETGALRLRFGWRET